MRTATLTRGNGLKSRTGKWGFVVATKQLDPTKSVAALFGAKVRQLRMEAGLSQLELGERVFVSHTRIAKIELATDPPGFRLAQQLDEALNAGGVLTELWPHIFQSPYPDFSQRFMELQARAVAIHQFSQVVPGLLQTPEYARGMLKAGQLYGDWDLDKSVEARLAQQDILTKEDPPWVWVVLDEAALYRNVGGREVMACQLNRLLEVNKQERVCVRICPRDQVDPAVMSGSMITLTARDDTRVVYLEGIKSGVLIENPDDVVRHCLVYDRLQTQVLSPDASEELIRDVVEEHYSCPQHSPS